MDDSGNHVDESSQDVANANANALNGFELHSVASFRTPPDSVGVERASHQAQLRRQATQPIYTPPPRIIPLGVGPSLAIAGETLVIDRELRDITIDTEEDQQRTLQVAAAPDRFMAPAISSNNIRNIDTTSTSINPYYEGQRLALQADPADPELAQPASPTNAANGWSVVPVNNTQGSTPPCVRSLHSAAVLNGNLYIFGGYNGQARVNDFYAFSFASRRWTPVLAAANSGRPPSPRDRHVSVVHGTTFYVFGGFDGTSRTNDFFGFDFTTMTWREVIPRSGRPPSERHSHAAAVHGNSMYCFGGYDGSYK